jgi:hypothetical protein
MTTRKTGSRVLLLASFAAFAAALVAGSVSAAGGGQPKPSSVVLKGAQVGPGYRLVERPDGRGVAGFVTLDMCGFRFASETLRTDRLQVNYVHQGSPVQLSNEVVSYQPGGAAQAMREVAAAVATCPKTPVSSTVRGVGPLTYRLQRLTTSHLLPGAIALRLSVSGPMYGKHVSETTVAIYQRRGSVLSAVYGWAGTQQKRESLAVHAAAASASNLLHP